jgi:hypothetical protein
MQRVNWLEEAVPASPSLLNVARWQGLNSASGNGLLSKHEL